MRNAIVIYSNSTDTRFAKMIHRERNLLERFPAEDLLLSSPSTTLL